MYQETNFSHRLVDMNKSWGPTASHQCYNETRLFEDLLFKGWTRTSAWQLLPDLHCSARPAVNSRCSFPPLDQALPFYLQWVQPCLVLRLASLSSNSAHISVSVSLTRYGMWQDLSNTNSLLVETGQVYCLGFWNCPNLQRARRVISPPLFRV